MKQTLIEWLTTASNVKIRLQISLAIRGFEGTVEYGEQRLQSLLPVEHKHLFNTLVTLGFVVKLG